MAKKKTKAIAVMGRPSKYKKEYCQKLIDHMAQGLSVEAFAGEIGISKKTVYNWMDVNAEFLHAKKIGDMKSLLWWEKVGRQGMLKQGFNAAVWVFNMKNRHGWVNEPNKDGGDKNIHTVKIELPGQNAEQVISVGPGDKEEE
jgi:hypothetical protein